MYLIIGSCYQVVHTPASDALEVGRWTLEEGRFLESRHHCPRLKWDIWGASKEKGI